MVEASFYAGFYKMISNPGKKGIPFTNLQKTHL